MINKIKKFKKQGEYPRKTKNWLRYRQENPNKFVQSSFRNVPLSHTKYKGKIKGQKAIVGRLKKTGKWQIQSRRLRGSIVLQLLMIAPDIVWVYLH